MEVEVKVEVENAQMQQGPECSEPIKMSKNKKINTGDCLTLQNSN